MSLRDERGLANYWKIGTSEQSIADDGLNAGSDFGLRFDLRFGLERFGTARLHGPRFAL